MPSSQSKISKYVWLYIALIVAMMAVVKVSTVETAMKAEHRLVTSALGQTSSDYVYSHAADWYRTIAVDWEMHRTLENMFIPTDEERARSKAWKSSGITFSSICTSVLKLFGAAFICFLLVCGSCFSGFRLFRLLFFRQSITAGRFVTLSELISIMRRRRNTSMLLRPSRLCWLFYLRLS